MNRLKALFRRLKRRQALYDLVLGDNPNIAKRDALNQYLNTGHYEINGKPVQNMIEIIEHFRPDVEEFDKKLNELIQRAWND